MVTEKMFYGCFAVVLFMFFVPVDPRCHINAPNVGTVLFVKSDVCRRCWKSDEIIKLKARQIMQDLIPKHHLCVDDDSYIPRLFQYFHLSLDTVRRMTTSCTQHILLTALADVMGGYLHVYVLPVTKQAFYAGNIRYEYAKKLYTLLDELKCFLRTNGQGWRTPIVATSLKMKVLPLEIMPCRDEDLCKELIISERKYNPPCNPGEIQQGPVTRITIPIPYLDNPRDPTSIALPFRVGNLRSLTDPNSAFIIEKYYVASMRCMYSRACCQRDIVLFNKRLHAWLLEAVLPHLRNNKMYPAFGGVLKILETMRQHGIGKESQWESIPEIPDTYKEGPIGSPIDKISDSCAKCNKKVGKAGGGGAGGGEETCSSMTTSTFVVIALSSAGLIWICVGTLFICIRCLRRRRRKGGSSCSSVKSNRGCAKKNNTFVEMFNSMKDSLGMSKSSRSAPECQKICSVVYSEENITDRRNSAPCGRPRKAQSRSRTRSRTRSRSRSRSPCEVVQGRRRSSRGSVGSKGRGSRSRTRSKRRVSKSKSSKSCVSNRPSCENLSWEDTSALSSCDDRQARTN